MIEQYIIYISQSCGNVRYMERNHNRKENQEPGYAVVDRARKKERKKERIQGIAVG